MEEFWVVYLCMILFVLILFLMKQKPDDGIKKLDDEKPSTAYSQVVSSAGRVLEYTEEELEASMQKLTGLFFSPDTHKEHPHPEHRAHQRETAGKEHQEKVHHTAQQNILDEIEQAVQETSDTEVYVRRRPQPPLPKRPHEQTEW